MLGVAFIHLLGDADGSLREVSTNYPPLAMTLATVGVLLVLAIEQMTVYALSSADTMGSTKQHKRILADGGERKGSGGGSFSHSPECEMSSSSGSTKGPVAISQSDENCSCEPLKLAVAAGGTSSSPQMTMTTSFDHDHDHTHALSSLHDDSQSCELDGDCMYDNGHSHSHSHSHSLSIATATGGGEVASEIVLVKAFIMEIAIAAHSIIIGVTFGAIGIEETLVALLIAMSFHQFFEGLALGTVVASARKQLGEAKVAAFVIVYSLTTPIGIAIGMLALETDGEPSENQVYAQGILNAIAAGNLIYIVLVEMMSHDFSLPSVAKNFPLRLAMLAALCCGDLFMAVLALWA